MDKIITLLKQNLTYFTEQASNETSMLYQEGNERKVISKSVCALMKFLTEQLDSKKFLYKFDYSLFDPTMNIANTSSYKQVDYALPFLHHLAIQKDELSAENLQEYIESFLIKYRNSLSYKDIMLLSTGSSRASANIRFAVKLLRNHGLIIDRDSDYKRSVNLSLKGILILIFLKCSNNNLKTDADLLKIGFMINGNPAFYNLDGWLQHLPFEIISELEENLRQNQNKLDLELLIDRLQRIRKPIQGNSIDFLKPVLTPLTTETEYSHMDKLVRDLREMYSNMWIMNKITVPMNN